MSAKIIKPEQLRVMSDGQMNAINALIRKHYIPHVGYFEIAWDAVAAALGHPAETRHRHELLQWLSETCSGMGWTIAMSEEGQSPTTYWVRFEPTEK